MEGATTGATTGRSGTSSLGARKPSLTSLVFLLFSAAVMEKKTISCGQKWFWGRFFWAIVGPSGGFRGDLGQKDALF